MSQDLFKQGVVGFIGDFTLNFVGFFAIQTSNLMVGVGLFCAALARGQWSNRLVNLAGPLRV
jgi:hypothetical protein